MKAATTGSGLLPGPDKTAAEERLWDLVERRAAATPDKVMLVDEDGGETTFGQFRDEAVAVAAGLARLAGIGPGSTVGWQLPTSPEAFIVMAALSRLQAVQAPLLPFWRENEVRFIADQIRADLLLVPRFWRGFDYGQMAEALTTQTTARAYVCEVSGNRLAHFALPKGRPEALGEPTMGEFRPTRWVFFTSGTTGRPKGVRHSDFSAMSSRHNLILGPKLDEDDVLPIVSPITHIGGVMTLATQMVAGYRLVVLQQFNPVEFPKVVSRFGATVLRGQIPVLRSCIDAQVAIGSKRLFPRLRACQAGGSARPLEIHETFRRVFGVGVTSSYGMTECPALTYSEPEDSAEHVAHTCGRVIPGGEIRIVDASGEICPPGEEGEIFVRGPQVFAGYVDESLNGAAFDPDGFFRSGDVGFLDQDGYLKVTGRIKDIIIRNGENISALEVENVLMSHPKIREIAIIGVPDPRTGERCCAVVQLTDPENPLSLVEIGEHCRSTGIARQKIPEELVIIDSIPRNESGKILKAKLRDMYSIGELDGVPPETAVGTRLL